MLGLWIVVIVRSFVIGWVLAFVLSARLFRSAWSGGRLVPLASCSGASSLSSGPSTETDVRPLRRLATLLIRDFCSPLLCQPHEPPRCLAFTTADNDRATDLWTVL